ncbi:hypothetical protein PBI_SCTP2_235 [Salicola phage SCTP-2]|nr:hypothetical protein PBI_SCTP2_235 [Salicola phage SCTP-2]
MKLFLEIELVPKTSWYQNLRKALSNKDWEIVKKETFKNASYRCEICNGKGNKHPVECHEVWEYDDINHIQTFIRPIALCPLCHQAKHLGLQLKLGRFDQTVRHIKKLNRMTDQEIDSYVMKCFQQHNQRSKHNWTVDMSAIKEQFPNITLKN